MIAGVIAAVNRLISHLRHPPHPRLPPRTHYGTWDAFQKGRAAEGCGDTQEAARLYLEAGMAGLPVAATFTWLAYYHGDGVLADPIAAHAWARRATALGWPDVLLGAVEGVGGHGQEADVDP